VAQRQAYPERVQDHHREGHQAEPAGLDEGQDHRLSERREGGSGVAHRQARQRRGRDGGEGRVDRGDPLPRRHGVISASVPAAVRTA